MSGSFQGKPFTGEEKSIANNMLRIYCNFRIFFNIPESVINLSKLSFASAMLNKSFIEIRGGFVSYAISGKMNCCSPKYLA